MSVRDDEIAETRVEPSLVSHQFINKRQLNTSHRRMFYVKCERITIQHIFHSHSLADRARLKTIVTLIELNYYQFDQKRD
jgi:hypothetical protein